LLDPFVNIRRPFLKSRTQDKRSLPAIETITP
jgi:hypothetical protein